MARPNYYVPTISRPLVAALYHESRRRKLPMTRLVDTLLRDSLAGTPGWQRAADDWPELEVVGPPNDGVAQPADR